MMSTEVKTEILKYEQRRSGGLTLWLRWDRWSHGYPQPEFGPRSGTQELAAHGPDDTTPRYGGKAALSCSFCGSGTTHTEALHNYLLELWQRGRALVEGQEISLRNGKVVTVVDGVAFSDGWYPSILALSDGKRIKVSLFDVLDIADAA